MESSDQLILMNEGRDRMLNAMKAFVEIMEGPNPLTKEEVRKLHQKRPHLTFLAKWY